ncbi:hypothetical protein BC937DRAFT_88333 [Endogone sp. FLAS-F59071]|nr:hypothetical protein BC937DRAFT_88333 [Endogone sp. FLAS-F59071]|eukprot:RUS18792.1 hypothetical protein BC937DRAFT_88333 [Endogone sp. FLAS-F59071]
MIGEGTQKSDGDLIAGKTTEWIIWARGQITGLSANAQMPPERGGRATLSRKKAYPSGREQNQNERALASSPIQKLPFSICGQTESRLLLLWQELSALARVDPV